MLQSNDAALEGNDTDSACEEDILEEDIKEPESLIPQTVLDFADHALAKLPPRWRNWITRMISGTTLISAFYGLVSMGPIGLISLVSQPKKIIFLFIFHPFLFLFRPI